MNERYLPRRYHGWRCGYAKCGPADSAGRPFVFLKRHSGGGGGRNNAAIAVGPRTENVLRFVYDTSAGNLPRHICRNYAPIKPICCIRALQRSSMHFADVLYIEGVNSIPPQLACRTRYILAVSAQPARGITKLKTHTARMNALLAEVVQLLDTRFDRKYFTRRRLELYYYTTVQVKV